MSDNMQVNGEKEKAQVVCQPNGKYRRIDIEGGFIDDEDDIEYFKTTQRRDVLNNLLLGDFNNVGDYVIKEPLMKELVIMYKVLIDSYFNNVYFVKSKYSPTELGHLQFCIMIKKHEDISKATAILKLLEPVKKAGGYIENTNSFTIATYTDINDEYFLSKVKKVFRIVSADDTSKQDESEVTNIILRLKNQLKLRTLSASAFAELEKNHYNARIEKLRAGGYDDLLDELKTLMNKAGVFIDPTSSTYYQTMNELLDQAIDNIGKKNPNRLKQINRELVDINKEFNTKSIELNNKVRETKDREDYFSELAKKEAELKAKAEVEKKASESKSPSKSKPTAVKSKPKGKVKAKGKANVAKKNTGVAIPYTPYGSTPKKEAKKDNSFEKKSHEVLEKTQKLTDDLKLEIRKNKLQKLFVHDLEDFTEKQNDTVKTNVNQEKTSQRQSDILQTKISKREVNKLDLDHTATNQKYQSDKKEHKQQANANKGNDKGMDL